MNFIVSGGNLLLKPLRLLSYVSTLLMMLVLHLIKEVRFFKEVQENVMGGVGNRDSMVIMKDSDIKSIFTLVHNETVHRPNESL